MSWKLHSLLIVTLVLSGCGGSSGNDSRGEENPAATVDAGADQGNSISDHNTEDTDQQVSDSGSDGDTATGSNDNPAAEPDVDNNPDVGTTTDGDTASDNQDSDKPAANLQLSSTATKVHWPVSHIDIKASYDTTATTKLSWQVSGQSVSTESIEHGVRLVAPAVGRYDISAILSSSDGSPNVQQGLQIEVLAQDLAHLSGTPLSKQQQQQLDQLILNAAQQPAQQHPRLYGSNQQWFASLQQIEQFDASCQVPGPNSGLGTINNMKDSWQNLLMGGVACHNNLPATLAEHRDAKRYLNDEIETNRVADNHLRFRMIHLLRRELFCDQYTYPCQFERSDVLNFAQKFLATEFKRLHDAPRATIAPKWAADIGMPADYRFNKYWHMANTSEFMVLDAAPAFQFWTLVLDVFDNSPLISDADEAYLRQELEYQIDSYLKQYQHQHWSLFNGNNWTVMLNTAALHWAILNYHEQADKAQQVLEAVLATNWLHRDFFLADGGYLEGASYAVLTSYPYVLLQHQLLMAAFGQPVHSFNWLRGPKIASWLVDSVLPDNRFVDFGDGWPKTGLSSHMALQLMYPGNVLNRSDLNPPINACELKRYFSHSYYDVPFYDPWQVIPMVFNDWQDEVTACQQNAQVSRLAIYPDSGLMRLDLMTDTPLSQQATAERPFYLQSRHNTLVATTTATNTPHREMDVGGIIWAAHGSRLLADMGYGRIVRNYYEYDLFDQLTGYDNRIDHMLGANTLVLPEAFYTYLDHEKRQRYQYRGQSYGHGGQLEQRTVSGVAAVRVDASGPYRDGDVGKFARPANEGHLQQYERWAVPVSNLGYLLVDLVQAKTSQTTQAEQWFQVPVDDNDKCGSGTSITVNLEVKNSQQLHLTPKCNQLSRAYNSDISANIYALSQHGGSFTTDIPDYWPNVEPFRSDSMKLVNGIATLQLTNQVNQREQRQLVRWRAANPLASDIRLFFLQTSADGQTMPTVSLQSEACAEHYCARLQVAEQNLLIKVSQQNGLLTLLP